ncbi:alkaline phosphatase family protein [Micromonospora sp. MS34]|uniref:alkaline phosphatase family protein n=1 Tax=Micromonospora sp. MS34 TaxID=3385971 RepID=UPI00399F2CB8
MSLSRARLVAASLTAVATAALVTAASGGGGVAVAAGNGGPGEHGSRHQLDHAFVIMLENHSRQGVVGDPNAPYLTHLANTYGNAENYYGVTHPSLPNYVAAISGSNWWVNDDEPDNRFDHTNLVDSLEQAHLTWGAYMEAMPADDKLADYWPGDNAKLYASKHNPFVLFPDIRNDRDRMRNVKPYDDLAADLDAHAPNFVFISPDQCNDMHGGVYSAVPGHPETPCPYGSTNDDANDAALKQKADAFVKQAVETITHSHAWTEHSAIFIVADEGDYNADPTTGGWESPAGCCDSPVLPKGDPAISPDWPGGVYGGGKVPAVVVTGGKPYHHVSQVAYNHYSLLRTLEDAWGLPELGYTSDHVQVTTMDEFLRR